MQRLSTHLCAYLVKLFRPMRTFSKQHHLGSFVNAGEDLSRRLERNCHYIYSIFFFFSSSASSSIGKEGEMGREG